MSYTATLWTPLRNTWRPTCLLRMTDLSPSASELCITALYKCVYYYYYYYYYYRMNTREHLWLMIKSKGNLIIGGRLSLLSCKHTEYRYLNRHRVWTHFEFDQYKIILLGDKGIHHLNVTQGCYVAISLPRVELPLWVSFISSLMWNHCATVRPMRRSWCTEHSTSFCIYKYLPRTLRILTASPSDLHNFK